MLSDVRQRIVEPVITGAISAGSLVYTDEYGVYAGLPAWGYRHKTVCHGRGEYARDEDGDGFCEVHPWTAPGAQGKNTASSANHGRVQPSIRPGVAARRPQALMIFAAPFPITLADFASDAPNGLDGAR